ncbi:hypothetical protein, partial [Jatrophihabitans sp.]|uniref:hypothetical protein n=1 Tax=Jatrophihabitans sp. TaxID=1932789 RepID=UPI0030C70952
NLVLLCGYHHREFERRGWIVTMVDGTPQWRPPSWLDPQQRLRRNTAHDQLAPEPTAPNSGQGNARDPAPVPEPV